MNNTYASGQLRAFIERAERLDREAAEIAEAIRELHAEVRGQGFDISIFRDVIKARSKDPAELSERGALFRTYMDAAS